MRLFRYLAFLLLVSAAFGQVVPGSGGVGGTITGQIQTATGGGITRGTLTFSLSQPAILANSASIATQQIACYTSAAGNIVGIPDPNVLPIVSVNTSSGTLPAATYYVKLFYAAASGTSASSGEIAVTLSSQGTVIVNAPVLQPGSATGYGVAISTTSGTETIQNTLTGWAQFQQSGPLTTGGAAPTVNTSTCNIYFSDQLVPTGTNYTVNLVNRNGSQVSGFPQTWCTYGGAGATINVSQGAPTGNCNTSGVFYPTPIFSNNSTGAAQSINTPITFNGGVTFNGTVINATPATYSIAGAFLDPTFNPSLSSIVNNLNFTNEFQLAEGPHGTTEAVSGGVAVPAGASVIQAEGIGGYATNSSTTTIGYGGYFQSRCVLNNTHCGGINPVVFDTAGLTTGVVMFNDDALLTPRNATSAYQFLAGKAMGLNATQAGAFGAAFYAYSQNAASTWVSSYRSVDGAATIGVLVGSLTANTGATTSNSQPIQFTSWNAGTANNNSIFMDSVGDLNTSFFAETISSPIIFPAGLGAIGQITGPSDQPLKIATSSGQNIALVPQGAAVVTTPAQLVSTLGTGTAPLSVTSTTPVATLVVSNHPKVVNCTNTAACAANAELSGFLVHGTVALTGGAKTVTALPFTGVLWTCTTGDTTTVANASNMVEASATTATVTGTGTDVIAYICAGK